MLFRATFFLALRRLLRQPAAVALLALMPAVALVSGILQASGSDNGTVMVALSLPADSIRARTAAEQLLTTRGAVRFAELPPDESLEDAVASGKYAFGYRFAQDFDRRAADGDWRGAVTRVTTPSVAFYPALDDRVAAAILEACWPDIAQNALARLGYNDLAAAFPSDTTDLARRMELRVETISGAPSASDEAPGGTGANLLPGISAIFLFVFALLAVTDFCLALSNGFFARLRPLTGTLTLFVPVLLATLLAGFLSAAAALLAGYLFSPPAQSPAVTIGLLLLYVLYLGGMSVFLCSLFARRGFPVVIIPFLAVSCVVLCPFLFDLTTLLPSARPFTALLPPTLFLRALSGNPAAAVAMAAGALLMGAAGAVVFRLRRAALP